MTRRSVTVSIILLAIAEATELIVFSEGTGPIRLIVGLAFVLLVPGLALTRLLRLPADLLTFTTLAIALSAAIDSTIALILLYAGIWSVQLALTVLTVITAAIVAIDLPPVRAATGRAMRAFLDTFGREITT
jgi:uncharacterized membrane protein